MWITNNENAEICGDIKIAAYPDNILCYYGTN